MPIFEYSCRKCGNQFERIVFRMPDQVDCPKCGSVQTEKLISAFATGGSSRRSRSSHDSGACGPGPT